MGKKWFVQEVGSPRSNVVKDFQSRLASEESLSDIARKISLTEEQRKEFTDILGLNFSVMIPALEDICSFYRGSFLVYRDQKANTIVKKEGESIAKLADQLISKLTSANVGLLRQVNTDLFEYFYLEDLEDIVPSKFFSSLLQPLRGPALAETAELAVPTQSTDLMLWLAGVIIVLRELANAAEKHSDGITPKPGRPIDYPGYVLAKQLERTFLMHGLTPNKYVEGPFHQTLLKLQEIAGNKVSDSMDNVCRVLDESQ